MVLLEEYVVLDEQEIDFQGLPIFSGIDEEEASLFVRQVGGYVQTFSKGARIPYTHGELPRIGIVLSGLVQVLLADPFGNEVLAYELKEGALFGNVWAVVGTDVCSSMMLEMRTRVSILWLPYREMEKVYVETGGVQGTVARNLFTILSRMMFAMVQKIEVLSQHTVRGRLRLHLIQQEKAQGTRKVKVPGRVQLAKVLECNRSALTREIGRMGDGGLIVCGDGWMELKE